ncbi:hypothetical protein [Aminobacter sp. MDW-2]|uniref:hypothetical protein n=1 Tax=Aminobacter sp. MDW-2 TaxID=2666139 RepID=UPI0012AFCF57|nr:hypothetical protein [Aminobacter sp. MDW-2]MRX32791.1 hypothetical protein [Aminobacter sp. MDW-2]QNH34547.1 hypothetical protein H5P29_00920 [Aminobacter sp. MDW-2]
MATLGELKKAGKTLQVRCENAACDHVATLSIDTLVDVLGEKHSAEQRDIHHKLPCSRCREAGRSHRVVSVTHVLDHDALRQGRTSNAYGRARGF